MTDLEIVYVTLAGVFSVLLIVVVFSAYRQTRLQSFRYRLFAVRDSFFMLVARGELREDSFLFQECCRLMNNTIRHIKHFRLETLAKAFIEENELWEAEDNAKRLMKEIESSSPEVQRVIRDFLETMLEVLVANSLRIKIWLYVREWSQSHLRRIKRVLPRPAIYDAYRAGEVRLHDVDEAIGNRSKHQEAGVG